MTDVGQTIELKYAIAYYNEPIVHLQLKDGTELGFPEIHELTQCAEQLSGHKPYLVLSDSRANVNVTAEGRRAASDPKGAPLHRGTAVLVTSNMLKFAMNFFNDYKKPPFPFRAFTDKQKAINWLLQLPLDK